MKRMFKQSIWVLGVLAFITSLFITGCNNDDDPAVEEPTLTGNTGEYTLFTAGNSGVTGKITFAERDDNSILVTIELSGVATGADHPAHIHSNTAVETGGIVISLTNVDATGKSETVVTALDDGIAISYSEMITFDGYVNVHNSDSDLGTLVAQGDIGQNALTGESVQYTLNSVSDPAVSGTAKFEQRNNGTTLLTIDLAGTTDGNEHPAHIHMNTAAEGGGIVISLNAINGGTGLSKTSVKELDDMTAITYDEMVEFDGYINVHNSDSDLGTLVAQGDIGSNG